MEATETITLLYPHARLIAEQIVERLKPHCTQIAIAGSVRRQKQTCGDIELVLIPKQVEEQGLFGPVGKMRDPAFSKAVRSLGELQKGSPEEGKYFQVITREAVQVDLFTAQGDNWGLILAIRTGSADYSKNLLTVAKRHGYHCEGGRLRRADGSAIPVCEEQDLFRLLGLSYQPPANRNL